MMATDVAELVLLQDAAPPLAAGVAEHAIEASFGRLQIQFVHKNLDYFVRDFRER